MTGGGGRWSDEGSTGGFPDDPPPGAPWPSDLGAGDLFGDDVASICEGFQLDLSCLVDGELDEPAAARAIAHMEDCEGCRAFLDDTRLAVQLHRDVSDPERLMRRYSALTGAAVADEVESLELVHRLATIFYQLGKAYILSATDPDFCDRVFEKAVAVETEQTRGRGFVDGVIASGQSEAGGIDWTEARAALSGQLARIVTPTEKGRRLLEEAIAVDPTHEGARLYLAWLLAQEGKRVRAAAEFRRIFRTAFDPENRGHAATQLGMLHGLEKEWRKALACFRWVRMSGLEERDSRFLVAGFDEAVCWAHLRRPERCIDAFRALLDRHPARVSDVVEAFAASPPELREVIDDQPELVRGLLATCPELFERPGEQEDVPVPRR
jgi:tetratricopeptide (TPR) repeat protein